MRREGKTLVCTAKNRAARLHPAAAFAISVAPLGDSSTVELRTLTPSILVRIQVPQPRKIRISEQLVVLKSANRFELCGPRTNSPTRSAGAHGLHVFRGLPSARRTPSPAGRPCEVPPRSGQAPPCREMLGVGATG